MRLEGSPILVTGAGGFLGAHLVRALQGQGALVQAWLRPGGDPWRLEGLGDLAREDVDLRDGTRIRQVLDRTRPRAIVHAAKANAIRRDVDPGLARAVNIDATRALIEWAETRGVESFLLTGSSTEYAPTEVPLHEGSPLAPHGVNGQTKAEASRILLEASGRSLPGVLLRIFNVFGPWDRESRFLPTVLRAVRGGGPLELTRRGLRRDWIYVDDVVAACLASLETEPQPGEIFNVGTGTSLANEEIVEVVESVLGQRARVREGAHPERPWDRGCWVADPTRARQRLGWAPRWTFREGLERMLGREGARA